MIQTAAVTEFHRGLAIGLSLSAIAFTHAVPDNIGQGPIMPGPLPLYAKRSHTTDTDR